MKKFIYTLILTLILNSAFLIQNCQSQWVQMSNGMGTTQNIASFAIKENILLAGTGFNYVGNGVFLSTDNGLTWSQTVLNNRCVFSLITYGNFICAGTEYGAWLSDNNGVNWTTTSLNTQYVYSLTKVGNNVFAAASKTGDTINVYSSANNGATWIPTGFGNHGAVTAFALNGNYIYAGCGNGVFLTTNNGNSWDRIGLEYNVISCLATLGNHIFAASNYPGNSKLFHSTNNGVSWTNDTVGMGGRLIYSLAVSGANIFAGTNGGVFLSTNNGANWIKKNQGFSSTFPILSLLIANNYIFAGTYSKSVWRRSLTEIIDIKNISSEVPEMYSLSQNYPNPFNPTTNIKFSIVSSPHGLGGDLVQLKVYDIQGREVQTLVNERLQPGTYEVAFDGSMLNSGVYFCKLITGTFTETKKMLFIK